MYFLIYIYLRQYDVWSHFHKRFICAVKVDYIHMKVQTSHFSQHLCHWLKHDWYLKSMPKAIPKMSWFLKFFPQRRDMKNQSDLSIAFSTDFLYQSRSGRRHKRREKWDVCTFICMYTTLVSALVMFGYHMICRLISKVISWYMGNHLFVQ